MNYAELRRVMSRIIPGTRPLFEERRHQGMVREKGRKSNYQQYDLLSGEWVKRERLLNTEEIQSFLEISMRAAACPMPFNMDIYDGFACSYNCRYCFPSGTLVLMADGTEKRIERVVEGDRVVSFNETTHELEPATVTQRMKRLYKGDLICIEHADGGILKMTPEHPVYTQRGWTEAQDLREGDEVLIW